MPPLQSQGTGVGMPSGAGTGWHKGWEKGSELLAWEKSSIKALGWRRGSVSRGGLGWVWDEGLGSVAVVSELVSSSIKYFEQTPACLHHPKSLGYPMGAADLDRELGPRRPPHSFKSKAQSAPLQIES